MLHPTGVRFAIATVVSLFAFLSLFFAVSDRLGGWPAGVLGATVLAAAIFLVSYFLSATLFPSLREQKASPGTFTTGPGARTKSQEPGPAKEELIEGNYKVEAGGYEDIKLGVKRGDLVVGHLREVSGEKFTWMILDEDNLVDYVNDDEYDADQLGEKVAADKVQWRVPRGGQWYLVLDATEQEYDLEVFVDLRLGGR